MPEVALPYVTVQRGRKSGIVHIGVKSFNYYTVVHELLTGRQNMKLKGLFYFA